VVHMLDGRALYSFLLFVVVVASSFVVCIVLVFVVRCGGSVCKSLVLKLFG
jgi:hypothetical protein